MLYQVKIGSAITVNGRDYTAGAIVDLDDFQAAFFRPHIEFADYLHEARCVQRNFKVSASGQTQHRLPFLDAYSLIESISTAATAVITTKEDHCFVVGNNLALFDADTCPKADGDYTVATAPTRRTLTLTGYDTSAHGQLAASGRRTILGRYATDVGWVAVGEVLSPASKTIKITESCDLVSEVGDRRIWFVADKAVPVQLIEGDKLTCSEAGLNNAVVEAVGSWVCHGQSVRMAVHLSAAATLATEVGDWIVERTLLAEGFGTVAGTIASAWTGANLTITWPALPAGSYYYRLQKTVGATLVDILRGQVTYE